MNRMKSVKFVSASLMVAAGVAIGSLAPAFAADDKSSGHAHEALMKDHIRMMEGAQGVSMMKEMMLKMAVHQHLVGEMAQDPQVQKMAKSPEMAQAMEDVKTQLQEHAKIDSTKAEIAKEHKEAMMVLAHAMMMQDKDMRQMLERAEKGQAH